MNLRTALVLLLGPLALSPSSALAQGQRERGPGPLIIQREPAPITLDAPLTDWHDGLPLGNGRVGAVVWGADNVIRISLDRGDLWDERGVEAADGEIATWAALRSAIEAFELGKLMKLHQQRLFPRTPAKLPVGRVEFVFPEGHTSRQFRLDLERAELTTGIIPWRVRAHVSSANGTIFVRTDGVAPQVRLVPPAALAGLGCEPATLSHEGDTWWYVQKTAGLSFAVVVREQRDDRGANYAITIADSREYADPLARARTWAEFPASYDYDRNITANHLERWRQHWQQSKIKVPDARLQVQYELARYLYGAGARAGQAPIARQGLWTADNQDVRSARGAYELGSSTHAIYGAYAVAGLFSEGNALFEHALATRTRAEAFGRSFFGVDGPLLPDGSSLSGNVAGGPSSASLTPFGNALLICAVERHWRFTRDKTFLESGICEWATAAGGALASLLVPGDNGALRWPISSANPSPEATLGWLAVSSNRAQAAILGAFEALERLALARANSEEARKWNELRVKLAPLDVEADSGALTIAPGLPYREPTRQLEHTLAIHPLGLLDIEQPDERKIITATLNNVRAVGTEGWNGATFATFAALCARAGVGDDALDALEKYLAFTHRNGLHAVDGEMSLDGNFLAMTALHEMLVQSWGGIVRVFPAVGARWADVEFSDLRAEGGFRVWATRKGGVTTTLSVRATVDGKLSLRDPFPGRTPKWNRAITKSGELFEIELKAGDQLDGEAASNAK